MSALRGIGGKLLRLLAGLRRPDTGTIRYDDTSLHDLGRRVLA